MLVMVVFFIAFRWIHLLMPLIRFFLLVLICEIHAEKLFFRHANPFHDMGPATSHAQGFGALRGAVLDFDANHSFLFSKKRFSASGCARGAHTHRGDAPRTVTRARYKIRATMRHTLAAKRRGHSEMLPEEKSAS